MTQKEQFLPRHTRDQPISLPQDFSDEEMARDWTLSEKDIREIGKYRKNFRPFIAAQLCAVRLYGRFLNEVQDLSPHIINYLNRQLFLPPSLTIQVPDREATCVEHRKNILDYLGFRKFDEEMQSQLETWLEQQAHHGELPQELFHQTEEYLLANHVVLPGPSILERLIINVCAAEHEKTFERLSQQLSPEIKQAIDQVLTVSEGEQRSFFHQLKEYPPSAKISSLQTYLKRYRMLAGTGIDDFETPGIDFTFLDYLFKWAKRYNAKDLKRFKENKRYALMACFLSETRKVFLDHLVKMHDQYLTDMCRHAKNAHEKKHREFRKRQKKAVDTILNATHTLLDWPEEQPLSKKVLFQQVDENQLRESLKNLHIFKRLEERGYGDLLLARYPSLRKYFAEFIHLPFAAERGSDVLMQAIHLIRQLDSGELKRLPPNAPISFIPNELHRTLKDKNGNINRNAWELGLALAIKDALRSGDLYLPKSKQHVSFWDLMLDESRWKETKEISYVELHQPSQQEVKPVLCQQFHQTVSQSGKCFASDHFAAIENGRLRLKRDDKITIPAAVTHLQKAIHSSMPSIRIEQLLMEVDQ